MTNKQEIIKYIEGRGVVWGGTLERELSYDLKCKPSTVGRECRMLEDDGVLLATYEKVDGKGKACVKYSIKIKETLF